MYPEFWGPAHPSICTHTPRILGSCPPSIWQPYIQGSGTHIPRALGHPTPLQLRHAQGPAPSTPHPGFQPPTDTGADEVPSLMLGRGETPRASACSPKGAGGTQWANLTGCVGVRKPTSKRRAPSAAPLPPQLPAPNPAPPSQGTGIGQRGDLGGTYRVTVASPNPAGEAARAWWGSALPNTHRHPSGKKNTPGKRADGREKKKNKPKTPTRPPPGAAEGAALAPRLGCGQGAPSR